MSGFLTQNVLNTNSTASTYTITGENGAPVKTMSDVDGDGKYDQVSVFLYDEEENLQKRYDGSINYNFVLDENGECKDINKDGKIDDADKVKHEDFTQYVDISYDEEGNPIESDPKKITGWLKFSAQKRSLNIEMSDILSKQMK